MLAYWYVLVYVLNHVPVYVRASASTSVRAKVCAINSIYGISSVYAHVCAIKIAHVLVLA